ncbi:MAG: mechanosensitive ion channel [Rhodospirillales bacterium]|nr:mechanosensitive ion channel [Rhodospirillales bacterium]
MSQLFDPQVIEDFLGTAQAWAFDNVFVVGNLVQIAVIAAIFLAARLISPKLETGLDRIKQRLPADFATDRALRTVAVLKPLCLPIVWIFLMWAAYSIAEAVAWPNDLINIAVSLLNAWVVIRVASELIRQRAWSQTISTLAWTIAALHILDLLEPTIALFDAIAINFDDFRISLLLVIKGVAALVVLLWAAIVLSGAMEKRIESVSSLTPAIQVLLGKLLKITLVVIAIVAALSAVGIDLTAFTVFGGALGVGIGFGLQKVVSNLVSGIILLLDKSIKPGDVIVVGNTYGWIKSLGARYASVITRDGTEHLIPNEDLITQRVENWSFSDNLVRLHIAVGISYKSDVRKAIECCLEAAKRTERVLDHPKTVCLLTGFGDSSVNLEIRVWINDPPNGVSNVKSEVFLNVWDLFHERGIEIPFPQRDIHIKSPDSLRAVTGTHG